MTIARTVPSSFIFASATGLLAIVAACSSRPGFDDNTPPPFDPADAEAPCADRKCSRDLRSVIDACPDAGEAIVERCADDKGCGNGACVDACESARLTKGSAGCSFWTLPADDGFFGQGACFVAMIANTWPRPITIRAELGSEALDISKSVYVATKSGDDTTYTPLTGRLPPGEVALVFLSQEDKPESMDFTRCPAGVTPALEADPIEHGTGRTRAFHIITDAPASAYSIFPYGGSRSFYPTATLLLPESSWDKSYVAVSTANLSHFGRPGSEPRTLQIVAAEDDTKVEMRPNATLVQGVGVESVLQGETGSWTLARGEVLQITQRAALSGSAIASSKPVGLFGGATCAFLPGELEFCDLTQQQIAPFAQWGSEYALAPFAPRIESLTTTVRETVPWGLVGAVDGTVLTYDPERPLGAPEMLAAGEVATFFTDALVVVKSQDAAHPFHAAVYMTGSKFNGGTGEPPSGPFGPMRPGSPGDPDFVNIVPSDQFLDRYVFFADHTYADTSLTLVRRKTAQGFMPVELECGGEVTGWAPLGASGEYEFAWVRLTKGFVPAKLEKGTCGYGRHEARSDGPFSVTVWGVDQFASYGYAGGQGSRPINDALPPPVN
ncbi:MAG: IgGFc-binding protein [Labilithrix sp.]|nr:IgGFc-binding protein [Labilithrix sp.]